MEIVALTDMIKNFIMEKEMQISLEAQLLLEYRPVLREAIKQWGEQAQIDMLHEEIGELMQAINKNKRKNSALTRNNLIEEIADVEILLEQLKIMVNCKAGVLTWKELKLKRLKSRLDNKESL